MAFVVEAMLLGGGALLFGCRQASVPVRSALGPVKLDLSKLPTPQPAPTAPPASAPLEAQDTPQDQPPKNPDPPAPELSEQEPRQSLEESTTPPAYQLPRDDADQMPLPDMSLLPPLDGAHRRPHQPAPPLSNGQTDRVSQFYEQLNSALRAAAHYPDEARGKKLTGQVRIAVHYRDGKAWGPWILQSSGFPALDQAVLDGTRHALWPPAPPELEGREIVVPIMGSFW